MQHVLKILDANAKFHLTKYKLNCTYTPATGQQDLLNLITKYEDLFNGTLHLLNTKPAHLNLQKGAIPYHDTSYPASLDIEQKDY